MFEVKDTGPLQLPNGLLIGDEWMRYIEMREIMGAENNMVANKQYARNGQTIRKIIESCTLGIGPAEDRMTLVKPGEIAKAIDSLPLADGVYLISRLRALSFGEEFSFSCPCPSCKAPGRYTVQLCDQPCTFRDEPPAEEYTVIVDDKTMVYRMLTMVDNQKLSRIGRENGDEEMTMRLFLQLKTVDGQKVHSQKILEKWPGRVFNTLMTEIRSQEFGMEVEVENVCGACSAVFEVKLPIGNADFFFPNSAAKS